MTRISARWGDSGDQSRTVIPFAANTVFTAHLIQQFKVESGALPPEGGAVSFNPPSTDGFYTARSHLEAVAAPAEGFSFGGWMGLSLAGIHGVSGNPARFPVRFAGLNYTGVFTQLPGQIPSQALPDSQGLANLINEVTFTIGGIAVPPADVLYAGAAPCCAGLYQFVVRVPPNAPEWGSWLRIRWRCSGVHTFIPSLAWIAPRRSLFVDLIPRLPRQLD